MANKFKEHTNEGRIHSSGSKIVHQHTKVYKTRLEAVDPDIDWSAIGIFCLMVGVSIVVVSAIILGLIVWLF